MRRDGEHLHALLTQVTDTLETVMVGQHEIIEAVLSSLLAGGHVLLEGAPGLGKTLLVRTLAQVLQLTHTRIQCTPDLTPTDILGTAEAPGPLFAHLVLADEINRAHPRTQSAFLEAMQERQITWRGVSHPLPSPFIVLATQNPIEMAGTFPLPEAQLDRFLFKLLVSTPSRADLREILRRTTIGESVPLSPLLDESAVTTLQAVVRQLPVAPLVFDYAARLVRATHPLSEEAPHLVKTYVWCGASPRAGQSLILGGKLQALLQGRAEVCFADLRAVALPCFRHRLILNYEGATAGIDPDMILAEVLTQTPEVVDDAAVLAQSAAR